MSYSTTLGRWIEKDPLGYVDGMNPYQFVKDSPFDGTDSTGLFDSQYHFDITLNAFAELGIDWGSAELKIANADVQTDWNPITFLQSAYHAQSLGFVALIRDNMQALQTTTCPSDAIRLIGQTMHTLQDAYSHTDWINGSDLIPFYDTQAERNKAKANPPHNEPYSLSNLIEGDPFEFVDAVFFTGDLLSETLLTLHGRLNADAPDKGRARSALLGRAAFDRAYELAKETTEEFIISYLLDPAYLDPGLLNAIINS